MNEVQAAPLGQVLLEFVRLGLISFGGANLAEMERVLVVNNAWITPTVLANGFALGQVVPGPNLLAVTHYGYAIAGLPGAAVSTLGFYVPTSVLSGLLAHAWYRHSAHPWAVALRNALLPFGAGVMLASLLVLWRTSIQGASIQGGLGAMLAGVAFLLLWRTRLNAAAVVVGAGVIGALVRL